MLGTILTWTGAALVLGTIIFGITVNGIWPEFLTVGKDRFLTFTLGLGAACLLIGINL